ncbi:MAG TPA: hemerythrin domain-containing protein [Acidimicrobiia bacterium]|nr:hemerythrin domain-containing protein [Acidimicrobiia bacterium]
MRITGTLHDDHEEVLDLLGRVERGETAPDPDTVASIVRELSVHAAAEETTVYPFAERVIPNGRTTVELHRKEHQLVKDLLVDVEKASPTDLVPLIGALAAYVRAHVEHEETKLFAKLEQYATPEQLEEVGAAFDAAKKTAPTHPHPHAPRRPPANVVANRAAVFLDRMRDLVGSRR